MPVARMLCSSSTNDIGRNVHLLISTFHCAANSCIFTLCLWMSYLLSLSSRSTPRVCRLRLRRRLRRRRSLGSVRRCRWAVTSWTRPTSGWRCPIQTVMRSLQTGETGNQPAVSEFNCDRVMMMSPGEKMCRVFPLWCCKIVPILGYNVIYDVA